MTLLLDIYLVTQFSIQFLNPMTSMAVAPRHPLLDNSRSPGGAGGIRSHNNFITTWLESCTFPCWKTESYLEQKV